MMARAHLAHGWKTNKYDVYWEGAKPGRLRKNWIDTVQPDLKRIGLT